MGSLGRRPLMIKVVKSIVLLRISIFRFEESLLSGFYQISDEIWGFVADENYIFMKSSWSFELQSLMGVVLKVVERMGLISTSLEGLRRESLVARVGSVSAHIGEIDLFQDTLRDLEMIFSSLGEDFVVVFALTCVKDATTDEGHLLFVKMPQRGFSSMVDLGTAGMKDELGPLFFCRGLFCNEFEMGRSIFGCLVWSKVDLEIIMMYVFFMQLHMSFDFERLWVSLLVYEEFGLLFRFTKQTRGEITVVCFVIQISNVKKTGVVIGCAAKFGSEVIHGRGILLVLGFCTYNDMASQGGSRTVSVLYWVEDNNWFRKLTGSDLHVKLNIGKVIHRFISCGSIIFFIHKIVFLGRKGKCFEVRGGSRFANGSCENMASEVHYDDDDKMECKSGGAAWFDFEVIREHSEMFYGSADCTTSIFQFAWKDLACCISEVHSWATFGINHCGDVGIMFQTQRRVGLGMVYHSVAFFQIVIKQITDAVGINVSREGWKHPLGCITTKQSGWEIVYQVFRPQFFAKLTCLFLACGLSTSISAADYHKGANWCEVRSCVCLVGKHEHMYQAWTFGIVFGYLEMSWLVFNASDLSCPELWNLYFLLSLVENISFYDLFSFLMEELIEYGIASITMIRLCSVFYVMQTTHFHNVIAAKMVLILDAKYVNRETKEKSLKFTFLQLRLRVDQLGQMNLDNVEVVQENFVLRIGLLLTVARSGDLSDASKIVDHNVVSHVVAEKYSDWLEKNLNKFIHFSGLVSPVPKRLVDRDCDDSIYDTPFEVLDDDVHLYRDAVHDFATGVSKNRERMTLEASGKVKVNCDTLVCLYIYLGLLANGFAAFASETTTNGNKLNVDTCEFGIEIECCCWEADGDGVQV